MQRIEWLNDSALRLISNRRTGVAKRRFLVFLVPRANMPSPLLGLPPDDRNYDLAVRCYERPGMNEDLLAEAEYVMTGGLSKFHAAALFLESCGLAQSYDGFFFLDGDLEFEGSQLSGFLDLVHAAGLDLAQPSVTRDSYCYWRMAYHQPSFVFRETSFVEVMCPYISQKALAATQGSFTRSISTYGLDLLWPHLVGDSRIGVIDAFQVKHKEKVDLKSGIFYKYLATLGIDPDEEEQRVLAEYGIKRRHAHSRRGFILEAAGTEGGAPRLFSVPLLPVEKFTESQLIIDVAMRLACRIPARPEQASAALLRPLQELLQHRALAPGDRASGEASVW